MKKFNKAVAWLLTVCSIASQLVFFVYAESESLQDVQSQITTDVVQENAIPTSNMEQTFFCEYNGVDYMFATMRGGKFMVYNLDTKQRIYVSEEAFGTNRSFCMDGYGNVWVSGASYYLLKYSFSSNSTTRVKVAASATTSSLNVLGLTWDPTTARMYYGTYNKGGLCSFNPNNIKSKYEYVSGKYQRTYYVEVTILVDQFDLNNDGTKDALYSAFGGMIVKDGYLYFGIDNTSYHKLIKYNLSSKTITETIDLVEQGYWGNSGHFLTYSKLAGDIALFGVDGTRQKALAIDISGSTMQPVEITGPMQYGFASRVSDPINGKVYCFGSDSRGGHMYELDVATLESRALTPDIFPAGIPKMYAWGSNTATISGDANLPGASIVTYKAGSSGKATDLVFYNIQTGKMVVWENFVTDTVSGNSLTPITMSGDGKTIFVGAYGDNRVAAYDISTGTVTHYPTTSHQVDGLLWHEGYIYAGNYQSATITQVNLQTGAIVPYMDLQAGAFNQARVHTLTAGDGKIFAGMIPDKERKGGMLAWFDTATQRTYVAAGPNPEDVYYASTVGVDRYQYVWYSELTGNVVDFDDNNDGYEDADITVSGVVKQRFNGLIYNQAISCLVYKDGYLYGCTTTAGGSGDTTDPDASAILFVYDVSAMKVVATFDPRTQLSGYPDTIEFFDVVAADPDVDGKFWAVTSGTLLSFTFDKSTKTISAKEELSLTKSVFDDGLSSWHPRSILFDEEYMYVCLADTGLCMLKRDNPAAGGYILGQMAGSEMVQAADGNIYTISGSDIIRLNTADFTKTTIAKNKIASLSANITLKDSQAVAQARLYFNNLTQAQKDQISNLTVLTSAEAKILQLKQEAGGDAVSITVGGTTINYASYEAGAQISAMTEGTVVLLKDCEAIDTVTVKPGVVLDLGGYKLSAPAVYSAGSIIDTVGTGSVAGETVVFSGENQGYLPVWDHFASAYRLVTAEVEKLAVTDKKGVSAAFWFHAALTQQDCYDIVLSGGVSIGVKFTWVDQQGNTGSGTAAADTAFLTAWAQQLKTNPQKDVRLTVTGLDGVKEFTITPYIEANGVTVEADELLMYVALGFIWEMDSTTQPD